MILINLIDLIDLIIVINNDINKFYKIIQEV